MSGNTYESLDDTREIYMELAYKYAFVISARPIKVYTLPEDQRKILTQLWSDAGWIERLPSAHFAGGKNGWRIPTEYMSHWPWEDRTPLDGEMVYLLEVALNTMSPTTPIVKKRDFVRAVGTEFPEIHPEQKFWRAKLFGILEPTTGNSGNYRVKQELLG
jgi:hypothetical protein